MRIYLILLSVLFTACAWSVDDVKEMEIVTKATAWLDVEPNKRSLSDGLDLIEACISAQKRQAVMYVDDQDPIDPVLNSLLMAIAINGSSSSEVRLVNFCDHLMLRYGNDFRRGHELMEILFANPEGSVSWSDIRRSEYLERREPMVIARWSRINAGAKKVLVGGARILTLLPDIDTTQSVEEQEKAMARYLTARDVAYEESRLFIEKSDFERLKEELIEPTTKWVRHWYLPNNLTRLNTVLSAAGFDLDEIKQISTGVK